MRAHFVFRSVCTNFAIKTAKLGGASAKKQAGLLVLRSVCTNFASKMRGINKVWKWLGERLRECGREWWFVVAFM
ncbi:MAG: hypothetical protein IKQ89_01550, partial [Muribaculaceae bacterium]|nr:hypothetical protein [Muribaculaceae bacterium]